jgi:hypothetical protein
VGAPWLPSPRPRCATTGGGGTKGRAPQVHARAGCAVPVRRAAKRPKRSMALLRLLNSKDQGRPTLKVGLCRSMKAGMAVGAPVA